MAYRSLELQGAFTPSRSDYVASIAAYLLELLVTAKGVPYQDLDKMFKTGMLMMRNDSGKSKKELDDEERRSSVAFFKSLCGIAALNKFG